MDILTLALPYPPSVNHYYIRTSSRVILGSKGKRYRRDVGLLCNQHRGKIPESMRLCLVINVFPPDKRKRDLDNILKSLLDAMQHADIYSDDNQIDMLTVYRRDVVEGGCVQIWVSECC